MDCFTVNQSDSLQCYRIRISETTGIPPLSESVIPGHCNRQVKLNTPAVLRPTENFSEKCDLLMAKELVNLENDVIPLRVMNINDRPQVLYKDSLVCMCEPVSEIMDFSQQNLASVNMDNLQKKELSVTLTYHLKQMFENSSANLTPIEKDVLKDLLLEYETSFSRNSQDLGQTSIVKHKIETGMAQPIKQRPRRVPQSKREEVSKVIKEMEDQGIIEPSISAWASPIVLVKKKNGETRFCIDYRKLNDVTVKDSHPLPRTDDCLDALSGSVWFSALDLESGYWQEEDIVKTAFTTSENGFWQFRTMPF